MQLLGRRLPNVILVLPILFGLVLLGLYGRLLLSQVRSSYLYIALSALFGILGTMLFWHTQDAELSPLIDKLTPAPVVQLRLLSVLFFLFYAFAVVALEILSPGAVHPTTFFAFVSFIIGLIFLRILISEPSRREVLWITVQILLTGLLIKLSWVYLNPYPYVSDTQFHWYFVQQTIIEGTFIGRGPYEFYPVFHLFSTTFFLLSTAHPAPSWLFPFINSLVIVATLPVFFLTGRMLYNTRVGLLASAFALIANYYFLSPMYKTNFFGVTFLLLATYGMFRILDLQISRIWVFYWLAAIGALLTHPVVFISLVFISLGLHIGSAVGDGHFLFGNPAPAISSLFLFVSFLMFLHTILFARLISSTIGIDETTGSGRLGLTVNFAEVDLVSPYTGELLANELGLVVPLLFIVPGILYCLHRLDRLKNGYAFAAGILYVFSFATLLAGRGEGFNITRLLLYISALTPVLTAIGFRHSLRAFIQRTRRHSREIIAIICVGLVLLAFLSMISHLNNFNGVTTNHVEHFSLVVKPSTLAAHTFVQRIPNNSTVASDTFTGEYIATTDPVRGIHTLPGNQERTVFFTPNWMESEYYIMNEAALRNTRSDLKPEYGYLLQQYNQSHSRIYHTTGLSIYA